MVSILEVRIAALEATAIALKRLYEAPVVHLLGGQYWCTSCTREVAGIDGGAGQPYHWRPLEDGDLLQCGPVGIIPLPATLERMARAWLRVAAPDAPEAHIASVLVGGDMAERMRPVWHELHKTAMQWKED